MSDLDNALNGFTDSQHLFKTLASEGKYFNGTSVQSVFWLSRLFRYLFACCCDSTATHCRKVSLAALQKFAAQNSPADLKPKQVIKLCLLRNTLKINNIAGANLCPKEIAKCLESLEAFESKAKESNVKTREENDIKKNGKTAVELGEKKPKKKEKARKFNFKARPEENRSEEQIPRKWIECYKKLEDSDLQGHQGPRGVLSNKPQQDYRDICLQEKILGKCFLYFDPNAEFISRVVDLKYKIAKLINEKNKIFYQPEEIQIACEGVNLVDEASLLTIKKGSQVEVKVEQESFAASIEVDSSSVPHVIDIDKLTPEQQQQKNRELWNEYEGGLKEESLLFKGEAPNIFMQGLTIKLDSIPIASSDELDKFLLFHFSKKLELYYDKDSKLRAYHLKKKIAELLFSSNLFTIAPKDLIFSIGSKQLGDSDELSKVFENSNNDPILTLNVQRPS